MTICLSDKIELITRKEFGVVKFDQESIILDPFNRNKNDVFVLDINHLCVKHVRLWFLSL